MANGKAPRRAKAVLVAALAGAAVLALPAPPAAGAKPSASAESPRLEATIRRDGGGIPHILAVDWAGIGYGYGYAFAQDNICTIAESYVTVRAERSRYFGPDGSYLQRGNGFSANNLNSDFFYQRIIDRGIVERLLGEPPPRGPVDQIKAGVRGYVAGYNRYLAETGVANLPDPRCRGAEWVKPISEIDVYRRFYQLALLASQSVAIDGIASAQPPAPGESPAPADPQKLATELGQVLPIDGIGSNAYGLGSEATDNGRGIVLANPHFPWDGPERFYQSHLTIPGKLNVSGASLFGVPLVLIGHTDNLAWSHTVSTAFRFTPFEETLVPGSPTTYLYDGEPRQMQRDTVTVMVRTDSGLEPRTRTLYSTHHGPVITSLAGVPLPWTQGKAFTMGDVNAANFRYLNHFFFVNQAQDVGRLDEVLRTYQGIPWVNTIAADSSGTAYYADIGAIPNVPDTKARTCGTPLGQATFQALRLPILNGALSACEWGSDPDAAVAGTFGPANEPSLVREDYVTNSNDSYWLSNPEQPLEGFARIIGDERSARSLRTRIGLRMIIERFADQSAPASDPLGRAEVQEIVFNNRQYAGELWRDQLVQLCENAPEGMLIGSNGPVDVSGACPVLAQWNLRDDLDSRGAILFRRFATRALASVGGVAGDPTLYTMPFSLADPVNTPRGLNVASPRVQQALADAVSDLRGAGIPLDAPLGDYQYERRGSERIPIHGGPGTVGVFNAINVGWVGSGAEPGYPNVPHGSSFVMVTQFTGGCPDDRSILTYSQSENPESLYFADQTRLYSEKTWVDPPFCESEVRADPSITRTVLRGG